MRAFFALALMVFQVQTLLGQAQFEGMKKELSADSTSSTGVGFVAMIQMVVSLLIVLALLKFVLPKMLTKFNHQLSTNVHSSIIVEESTALGTAKLHVVQARGKTLLISTSPQGVACLADLTQTSILEKNEPAFFEVLDQQQEGPINQSPPSESQDNRLDAQASSLSDENKKRLQDTLSRLNMLTG